VELDPQNGYIWLARGGAQLALGFPDKAIADRTKAIDLAPRNAVMWYGRAVVYSTLGENEKAADDLHTALRLNAGLEEARRLLSNVEKNLPKEAARSTITAPNQAGAPPAANANTGAAAGVAQAGPPASAATPRELPPAQQEKPAAPVSELKAPPPGGTAARAATLPTGLADSPAGSAAATPATPSAQQLHREARELLDNDQFVEAVSKLKLAVAWDAENPLIWNALGYGEMRLGHFQEALAALDRAIALRPDYQNAFINRAVLKRQMGDRQGAAQDSERAAELGKKSR
jgi:tetratricopeptide (TPR) repeat protein